MLRPADIARLACPACRGALAYHGGADAELVTCGLLRCEGCAALWTVEDGLPRLYREDDVRGNDWLLRVFYDGLPSLHDPAVLLTLPLFQVGGTARAMRAAYIRRLELDALRPRPDGEPLRLLEVGVGTGANLPLVREALPPGLRVELWGCDLSTGMISMLRRRLSTHPEPDLRVVMADAHALPFPDAAFDRVFHVGALGSYRDPARALSEMARVARPGTPIVAVDEQLDPSRSHGLLPRAAFRLVTFYERNPHCPVEALPPGADDVLAEQIPRFFYCLRFRMPASPA